jgi:ketosteroid isomerase-like protein
MSEQAMRGFGRAFCDALMTREPQRVADYIDDDVEWIVFGPVDLFPFFGERRGKKNVLAACADMARHLQLQICEREMAIADGSNAAWLMRFTAVHFETGRTLSLRMAMFARFRDGRLVSARTLFDSFDAAEQVLGRHIDLGAVA